MVQYQFASTAKEKLIKSKNNGGIYLNNVIKIFKQIQSTTSTNEKINIIKKNSDNEMTEKFYYSNIIIGVTMSVCSKSTNF